MKEWIGWDIGYIINQEIIIYKVKYKILSIDQFGDAVKLKLIEI